MFCTKCGKQIDDNAKFCVNCGNAVEIQNNQLNQQNFQPQTNNNTLNFSGQTDSAAKTNYADTSFKCAIWGLILFICGIGLLTQPFAFLFGILAIKNKEAETAKAWIGTVIGAIGTFLAAVIVYKLITEEI